MLTRPISQVSMQLKTSILCKDIQQTTQHSVTQGFPDKVPIHVLQSQGLQNNLNGTNQGITMFAPINDAFSEPLLAVRPSSCVCHVYLLPSLSCCHVVAYLTLCNQASCCKNLLLRHVPNALVCCNNFEGLLSAQAFSAQASLEGECLH